MGTHEPGQPWATEPSRFTPEEPAATEASDGRMAGAWRPWRMALAGVFGAGLVAVVVVVVVPRYEEDTGPWRAVIRAQEWPVSSRIGGTMARVYVANGRFVTRGELLVELDTATLGVEQAAARRRLLFGKADVLAIQHELAITKADLEGLRSVWSVRGKALGTALANYLVTRDVGGTRRVTLSESRELEQACAAALAVYLTANLAFSNALDLLEEKQAASVALEINVQNAERSLHEIEWRLSCARILAPVDGRVVFDKAMFNEPVAADKPFLKVVAGDPWVVADLAATQLDAIKSGTRVTISVEAIKGRTFHGEVSAVGSLAYAGRRSRPWWGSSLPLFQVRETAAVKITFAADSLLGFEDVLEPGLPAWVQCNPDLKTTRSSAQTSWPPLKEVAGP